MQENGFTFSTVEPQRAPFHPEMSLNVALRELYDVVDEDNGFDLSPYTDQIADIVIAAMAVSKWNKDRAEARGWFVYANGIRSKFAIKIGEVFAGNDSKVLF